MQRTSWYNKAIQLINSLLDGRKETILKSHREFLKLKSVYKMKFSTMIGPFESAFKDKTIAVYRL